MTARTVLAAPTIFYSGPGGSLGNTGLSPAQALPTAQDIANLLYEAYDLGGMPVEMHSLAGTDPGVRFSGLMVGQRGLAGLVWLADAGFGSVTVQPSGAACGLALDSGALLSIADFVFDNSVEAAAGHAQDVIQMGQAAHLALYGSNRIIQNTTSYNGITLGGCSTLDIQPQSWGSPFQNGGHLYIQGEYQDFIQTDQCANVEADCNAQHGLISCTTEASAIRSKPYWAVAFADPASGVMLLSGIDFGGVGGDGYRYRIRKGGTLDLNLVQDPNQVNVLPGSQPTAWPVEGYLI